MDYHNVITDDPTDAREAGGSERTEASGGGEEVGRGEATRGRREEVAGGEGIGGEEGKRRFLIITAIVLRERCGEFSAMRMCLGEHPGRKG